MELAEIILPTGFHWSGVANSSEQVEKMALPTSRTERIHRFDAQQKLT